MIANPPFEVLKGEGVKLSRLKQEKGNDHAAGGRARRAAKGVAGNGDMCGGLAESEPA
jgi:hypothetical protein